MTYLIVQTLNGLFSAALLFLIASGLTLAFGVMRIVNIAHGSFYMLGVYVAYTVTTRTGSLLLGVAVALVAVAAIGFLMQRFFLRRFASQPLAQMMMTMGFALFFRDAALMIWGGDPFTLTTPAALRGSIDAGGIVFPWYRLFVIAVAALVGVALWALNETDAHRRARACDGGRPGDGRRHRHQRVAALRRRVRGRRRTGARSAA